MTQIELPIETSRLWPIAAFGAFVALTVGLMAWNFRTEPAPPITVNVKTLECVDLSSAFHVQEGWKRVHAADEYRVISYAMNGRAEYEWFNTTQCWEAGKTTNRFLIHQMWWRPKKAGGVG